jgi:hypothetical protein
MTYALGPPLADLTAAATTDEAGAERQLGSLGESCRYLSRRVEAAKS